MAFTLTELVARFGGELLGDGSITIRQVAPLDQAQPDEIGFVSQARYLTQLADTRAAAVILPLDARDASALPRILTANPYLYFARVSGLLNPPPRPPAGIHPAASVAPDAQIAADASIGAGAVVGAGARVGARTVIGPNCVVGDRAEVEVPAHAPDARHQQAGIARVPEALGDALSCGDAHVVGNAEHGAGTGARAAPRLRVAAQFRREGLRRAQLRDQAGDVVGR